MAQSQEATYHDTVTSRTTQPSFTSPSYDPASTSSNHNTTDAITPSSNIDSSTGITNTTDTTQAPRRTSFAEPANSSAITYSNDAGTDPSGTARRSSFTPRDSISGTTTTTTTTTAAAADATNGDPALVNPSTETDPLNAHHRPSIAEVSPDDPVQGLKGDTTIRRASLAQNAPGRAGDIGEAVMGAFGAGGSRVERPKEDQGIGEKIVEFFGV